VILFDRQRTAAQSLNPIPNSYQWLNSRAAFLQRDPICYGCYDLTETLNLTSKMFGLPPVVTPDWKNS